MPESTICLEIFHRTTLNIIKQWADQEKRRTSVQDHQGGSQEDEVEVGPEEEELLEVQGEELELDLVLLREYRR